MFETLFLLVCCYCALHISTHAMSCVADCTHVGSAGARSGKNHQHNKHTCISVLGLGGTYHLPGFCCWYCFTGSRME